VDIHREKRPRIQTAGLFSSWRGLLLAEHGHLDGRGDVGVQRDLDREVADLLERPLRHAHVGTLDFVALFLQRFDDVVVGDRAEEASVGPLLRDLQREAVELGAALLRFLQRLGLRLSRSARRASKAFRLASVARFACRAE